MEQVAHRVHKDHPELRPADRFEQAPAQISTQGEYNSPRGCRGSFASIGTAQATHIEADFNGSDGQLATFAGRVVLTKQ